MVEIILHQRIIKILTTRHADGKLRLELTHWVVLKLAAHAGDGTVVVLDARQQHVEQPPSLHRQSAATHLVAGERSLIHYQAINTSLLQQTTTYRTSRAGTNDQHINLS